MPTMRLFPRNEPKSFAPKAVLKFEVVGGVGSKLGGNSPSSLTGLKAEIPNQSTGSRNTTPMARPAMFAPLPGAIRRRPAARGGRPPPRSAMHRLPPERPGENKSGEED